MVIEPKLIDHLWPHVWPLIKKIVVLESEEQLLDALRRADRLLIVVGDGVAIVRACGDLFEINYVGGKNAKAWWPEMSKIIDGIAAACKSKKIIAFGRDAWMKLAPDYEATKQRIYIKEVA